MLQKQVEHTIGQHALLEKEGTTLVAVSGGADSVALLLVLRHLGYTTMALHCNFHLRGQESDRDEAFVTDLCLKLGVPLLVKHFETQTYATQKRISIEMAARELRYAWFEEMRQETLAQAICVAHHMQDQAETLLLNMIRGTGIRGMAGMHYRNGHIVRPMLDCSKENIVQFLQHQQQNWVEDSTNRERDAQRNCLRLDVMPMLQGINPKAIRNMAMAARHIQEALPLYEEGLQAHTQTATGQGRAITTFKAGSRTILHEALQGYGFNATQETNIWEARSGAIVESATHRLLKDRDAFVLKDKAAEPTAPCICEIEMDRTELKEMQRDSIYLDSDRTKRPLQVRRVQAADRITPFGMKGSRLVSDILTDLKMNRFEKEDQYVLTDAEGTILWIIGRKASNHYRVDHKTKRVLCISIEEQQQTT